MTPLSAVAVRGPGPGLRRVVAVGFDDVAELRQAKRHGRRRDAAGVLGKQAELRVRRRGQFDLLLERPGRVAEEGDLDFLSELAAGRHDGGRPRERADVQAVVGSRRCRRRRFRGPE